MNIDNFKKIVDQSIKDRIENEGVLFEKEITLSDFNNFNDQIIIFISDIYNETGEKIDSNKIDMNYNLDEKKLKLKYKTYLYFVEIKEIKDTNIYKKYQNEILEDCYNFWTNYIKEHDVNELDFYETGYNLYTSSKKT